MKSTKEWISISDMMTGLMIVFLFISVLYMSQIQKKHEQVQKITKEYINYKEEIYKKLIKEFEQDLKKWKAEIIKKSLVIRFLSPNVMFDPMKSVIKPEFKKILSNFCPRYFKVLYNFKEFIEEIRIEGHTSKEWIGVSYKEAYFKNMELSQNRTRSVLQYCTTIKKLKKRINNWATRKLTANGLSSSRPICKDDTLKCRSKNRRVEFRIQINESNILDDIVKELKNSVFKIRNKNVKGTK